MIGLIWGWPKDVTHDYYTLYTDELQPNVLVSDHVEQVVDHMGVDELSFSDPILTSVYTGSIIKRHRK